MWKSFLSEDAPVASKRVEDITNNNSHYVLLDGLFSPCYYPDLSAVFVLERVQISELWDYIYE